MRGRIRNPGQKRLWPTTTCGERPAHQENCLTASGAYACRNRYLPLSPVVQQRPMIRAALSSSVPGCGPAIVRGNNTIAASRTRAGRRWGTRSQSTSRRSGTSQDLTISGLCDRATLTCCQDRSSVPEQLSSRDHFLRPLHSRHQSSTNANTTTTVPAPSVHRNQLASYIPSRRCRCARRQAPRPRAPLSAHPTQPDRSRQ